MHTSALRRRQRICWSFVLNRLDRLGFATVLTPCCVVTSMVCLVASTPIFQFLARRSASKVLLYLEVVVALTRTIDFNCLKKCPSWSIGVMSYKTAAHYESYSYVWLGVNKTRVEERN